MPWIRHPLLREQVVFQNHCYHISYAAIVHLGPMGDPSFLLQTGKQEMRAEEPTQ